MDYRIEHSQTDEILRVRIFGVSNESNANAIAQDILAVVDRNDATRSLVDIRVLAGRLIADDLYWHVQKYPRYTARVKVAVVDLKENHRFDELHETMAKNRGFNMQYFYEVAEAERWLLT